MKDLKLFARSSGEQGKLLDEFTFRSAIGDQRGRSLKFLSTLEGWLLGYT